MNNPVGYVDPNGLWVVPVIVAAGIAWGLWEGGTKLIDAQESLSKGARLRGERLDAVANGTTIPDDLNEQINNHMRDGLQGLQDAAVCVPGTTRTGPISNPSR